MNRAETRASIKTRREAAKSLYLSGHSADQVAVVLGVSVHTAHEYKPYAMQHGRAGFYTVGKEGRIKRAYPARPIREAIEALFWTGLTVREIAAIHNLSIRTIKRLTPKELRRRNSAGGGDCKDTETTSEEATCQTQSRATLLNRCATTSFLPQSVTTENHLCQATA